MAKSKLKTISPKSYRARLQVSYDDKLRNELLDELKVGNMHRVPRLEKVIVSVGLGRSKDDKKVIATAGNTLLKITGQKPIAAYARKSIASFKLREGSQIGLKVTLRGDRMYEFTDRLINIVLPRVRDFRGVRNSSFDRFGNYSIGFIDQSVFPELSFEETATTHGLQVNFVINPGDSNSSKLLLQKFGMPFEKTNTDDASNDKEIFNG